MLLVQAQITNLSGGRKILPKTTKWGFPPKPHVFGKKLKFTEIYRVMSHLKGFIELITKITFFRCMISSVAIMRS